MDVGYLNIRHRGRLFDIFIADMQKMHTSSRETS